MSAAAVAIAAKPRKKTVQFETKPVTFTRFIYIPVDEKKDLAQFSDAFLISGEEGHNDQTWDAIRSRVIQGPFEAIKLLDGKAERQAWGNGNGRLVGLEMNERASSMRYQWLAKNRPHLDVGQLEYHCLVVGEIVFELPQKGTVVINRDLTHTQIKGKLGALQFTDAVEVIADRVYCANADDAMMVSVAIRGRV